MSTKKNLDSTVCDTKSNRITKKQYITSVSLAADALNSHFEF